MCAQPHLSRVEQKMNIHFLFLILTVVNANAPTDMINTGFHRFLAKCEGKGLFSRVELDINSYTYVIEYVIESLVKTLTCISVSSKK